MSDTPVHLSAERIERLPGLDKTHFLNKGARRLNKSLGDATGLSGIGVHLIEVQPGASTSEPHVHLFEDEAVYVLSGHGTLHLGDRTIAIGPGDFMGHAAGGAPHSIENTGDAPLRCLVIGARLAHDVVDYPRLGKRLFRNAGQPWNLVEIAAIETPGGQAGRK